MKNIIFRHPEATDVTADGSLYPYMYKAPLQSVGILCACIWQELIWGLRPESPKLNELSPDHTCCTTYKSSPFTMGSFHPPVGAAERWADSGQLCCVFSQLHCTMCLTRSCKYRSSGRPFRPLLLVASRRAVNYGAASHHLHICPSLKTVRTQIPGRAGSVRVECQINNFAVSGLRIPIIPWRLAFFETTISSLCTR